MNSLLLSMSSSLSISSTLELSPFFGPVGFDIDDIIKTKISVGFGFIKSHEFSFTIMMMMMMMTMFSV